MRHLLHPKNAYGPIYFMVISACLIALQLNNLPAQSLPRALQLNSMEGSFYLPDFSYAGYKCGEYDIPKDSGQVIYAQDYGVIPDDGIDDSDSLIQVMNLINSIEGKVTLQLPPGRIILSDILFIERGDLIIKGSGSGALGTEIYCPRPMMYMPDTEILKELREYLKKFDKRQVEPQNNIDLPFSQYAWAGGVIWTHVPGERVKSYLSKYDVPPKVKAHILTGERGTHVLTASEVIDLKVGDVVQLQLFNHEGSSKSKIIVDLYKSSDVNIGSHHWNFPQLPIVRQELEIVDIVGNEIHVKTPLTITIDPEYNARIVEWKHLKEVGIQNFKITFPDAPYVAHHVEPGNNAIYLTRLFDSWVQDVVIHNADSGILTEEIANVTIKDIVTQGQNKAHYTVAMAGVHNVLVENLKVFNLAEHPLSFNTFSTKNVYKNCQVHVKPILDQHSGANHQNLFDQIIVYIDSKDETQYPLFAGGGAGYWKPSHGAYNTFWNIEVIYKNGLDSPNQKLLYGMSDGPYANLIGIHSNHDIKVEYGPDAYLENINAKINKVPSLYDYQLQERLTLKPKEIYKN